MRGIYVDDPEMSIFVGSILGPISSPYFFHCFFFSVVASFSTSVATTTSFLSFTSTSSCVSSSFVLRLLT
jgi:hypothetical protein